MQNIRTIFRLICLGAVLAASAIVLADFQAHTKAWLAYSNTLLSPPPGYAAAEAESAFVTISPWLLTAVIQGLTFRKQSIAMDCARAFSLLAAYISISSFWPEMQSWRAMSHGPYGEPLPQGDFDGGIDVMFSVPALFFSVMAVVFDQVRSRFFSTPPAPIR